MSLLKNILTILMLLFGVNYIQDPYELTYPEYFPPLVYNFDKNPLSQEKISLGKILFYDPILSADNSISCASCHSSYNAFAHTDHAISHGIKDSIGTRNAPALINLAWQNKFNWDGAINHLDMQALAPINDPKEMGETTQNVIKKLRQSSFYKTHFFNAFGDSLATGEMLLKSLAQFQLTLISADSKYDRVRMQLDSFNSQQQSGYQLFKKHCNQCHTEPLFTNGKLAKNGLPIDNSLMDYGRMAISHDSMDSLVFKIPTLRNLQFTYPYMHDGRFSSIRQVIQHYDSENFNNIALTNREKVDLTTFLLTLNDTSFVFESKHQFPNELKDFIIKNNP